jgi:uncharacterized membrane protein
MRCLLESRWCHRHIATSRWITLAGGLVSAAAAVGAPPTYYATVLPQVDIGAEAPITTGFALNNATQVVGSYGFPEQGFLWSQAGGVVLFSDLFGWESSYGLDINDSGAIVGFFRNGAAAASPFVATLDGNFTLLPKLVEGDDITAAATGISSNGLIAGYCATEPDTIFGAPTRAAFWREGVLTDIGTLGGDVASAAAVNSDGVVTGYSNEPGIQAVRAFRWTEKGGIQALPRLQDGFVTMAYDVNEDGVIAGGAEGIFEDGYGRAAAYWDATGEIHTLPLYYPAVPGIPQVADAVAINNLGQMVGSEMELDPFQLHAMLWQDGQGYPLKDYVIDLPDGLQMSNAYDINDRGEILAWAFDQNAVQFVAILLTPRCEADLNGDGILDLFDFLEYVNAFNAGHDAAECDGEGGLTLFDFLCYVNAFNAGC